MRVPACRCASMASNIAPLRLRLDQQSGSAAPCATAPPVRRRAAWRVHRQGRRRRSSAVQPAGGQREQQRTPGRAGRPPRYQRRVPPAPAPRRDPATAGDRLPRSTSEVVAGEQRREQRCADRRSKAAWAGSGSSSRFRSAAARPAERAVDPLQRRVVVLRRSGSSAADAQHARQHLVERHGLVGPLDAEISAFGTRWSCRACRWNERIDARRAQQRMVRISGRPTSAIGSSDSIASSSSVSHLALPAVVGLLGAQCLDLVVAQIAQAHLHRCEHHRHSRWRRVAPPQRCEDHAATHASRTVAPPRARASRTSQIRHKSGGSAVGPSPPPRERRRRHRLSAAAKRVARCQRRLSPGCTASRRPAAKPLRTAGAAAPAVRAGNTEVEARISGRRREVMRRIIPSLPRAPLTLAAMKPRVHDPLRLAVGRFAKEGGRLRPWRSPARASGRVGPYERARALRTVAWTVSGRRARCAAVHQLWLHVSAAASMNLRYANAACNRCLRRWPCHAASASRRTKYRRRDRRRQRGRRVGARTLVLHELVEDELILALPLVPRSRRLPQPLAAPATAENPARRPNPSRPWCAPSLARPLTDLPGRDGCRAESPAFHRMPSCGIPMAVQQNKKSPSGARHAPFAQRGAAPAPAIEPTTGEGASRPTTSA